MAIARDILAVYNPRSTNATRVGDIEGQFSQARVYQTTGDFERDRDAIHQAAQPGTDLISFGGDGTANLIVNSIAHAPDVRYLAYPSGNGNDMGSNLYHNTKLTPSALFAASEELSIAPIETTVDSPEHAYSRYALTYVGIGWTALFAESLNHTDKREAWWYRYAPGRAVSELSNAFGIAMHGESFAAQIDDDNAHSYHELLWSNGRTLGKYCRLPTSYREREVYFVPYPAKPPLRRMAHIGMTAFQLLTGTLRQGNTVPLDAATHVETASDTAIHFDAEPAPLPARSTVSVGTSPTTITMLATRTD